MTTVLVVDDEYAIAATLQEFLEDEGFTVLTARNGQAALDQMSQKRPDLLLMDVMMPILDGVETVRRMRENNDLKDLPVILMSAAPRRSLDPSIDSMAAAFFRKPPDLQRLLDTISKLTR
jgi:CheY-like chemotaxis protein